MSRSLAHSLHLPKSEPRPATRRSTAPSVAKLGPLIPVAAAIFTGVLVTRHSLLAVMLVGAFVLLITLARVPWLPYVLVTASVATFAFYSGWPEVLGIKVPELLLAAGLLAGGTQLARGEWRAPSIETLLVGFFLTATAGGIYLGLTHGATLDEAVKAMRPMVFYAAFWPAAVVARDPRQRLLVMRLGAIAATAVVGFQLAQIQVGLERPLFAFVSGVEDVALTPQPDGFLRVRPPALTLIYVVTIFAATYLLWGPRRQRLRVSLLCGVGVLGVLLSLNRNMILGIVLGLAITAVVVPRRNRLLIVGLVSALLAVTVITFVQGERPTGTTGSVIERVLSIGDVSDLRAGTLSDRSYENRFALDVLKREPIAGIGWGTPYGATLTEYRDGRLVTGPRGFMHQQYLWIWMRTGLAGLLVMLILLGVALTSAVRWSRRRAWDDQSWLGPAVLASCTAFAASATVGTYLTNPESIVVLMGVLALAYALRGDLTKSEKAALA